MIHYATYTPTGPATNCGKPWPGKAWERGDKISPRITSVTCLRCLGFADPRADLADALADLRAALWSRVHPALNWVLRAVTRRG